MFQGWKGPDHKAPLMTLCMSVNPSQNWTYKIEYWTVLSSSQVGNFHVVLRLHDPDYNNFHTNFTRISIFFRFNSIQPFCCQSQIRGVNNVDYIQYQELMSWKKTNKN